VRVPRGATRGQVDVVADDDDSAGGPRRIMPPAALSRRPCRAGRDDGADRVHDLVGRISFVEMDPSRHQRDSSVADLEREDLAL